MSFATIPCIRPFVALMILVAIPNWLHACTTAVISGRATADGRPLLWKNRDTWQRQNEMLYDSSGRFAFVGVANAEAVERIRMGCNTAGFCIENSVSADLDTDDLDSVGSGTSRPSNGELIRKALQTCATAADFQSLLEQTNKTGRATRGNFGVIDATGAAMIFEVGPNRYKAFDANDPQQAPDGILVRANFSETGLQQIADPSVTVESAYSARRYARADKLTRERADHHPLDVRFLLQQVARDINGCAASCFSANRNASSPVAKSIHNSRMLNRSNTVSAVVFRGVLPEEPASNTIMWTILGEPLFSIAIPAWPTQGAVAKVTNGDGGSELCQQAIHLRSLHYDPTSGDLSTQRLSETTDHLRTIENRLMERVQKRTSMDSQSMTPQQRYELHEQSAQEATKGLRKLAESLPAFNAKSADGDQIRSIDFQFDDDQGTRLAAATNAAGSSAFNGGFTDSETVNGVFRIGRNKLDPVNRYATITPRIRVRGQSIAHRGYLVADIRGWNLRGQTLGEEVRIGFTSRSGSNYQTAAMRLVRTDSDQVTLSGVAFGDGSTSIEQTHVFPAKLDRPIQLVIQLDKASGNPGEGETGGEYQVFFRYQDSNTLQTLGTPGKVRRSRNGNEVHLRTAGRFAARDERFDIDRIYFTLAAPVGLP